MRDNLNNSQKLQELVSKFEATIKTGDLGFFEKSDFSSLIEHYESQESFDNALTVATQALSQHQYSVVFYLKAAQLLVDKNKYAEALEYLETAELYDANELEIYLLRAEALNMMGSYQDALNVLQDTKFRFDKESYSDIYFCEAFIHEHAEKYRKMFISLSRSILADPKNHTALDRMWLCVELAEMYEESIEFHLKLIDINPYSHLAWYNLGHAYSCLDNHDEAIEAYEYAFIIKDDFEFAYRDCADACLQGGYFSKALKIFNQVVQKFTPDSDLFAKLGQCHEGLENIEQAKTYYGQAIKLDPQNDTVFYLMGECLRRQGYSENAIDYFKSASEIDNRKEEYLISLSLSYMEIGDEEKAFNSFRESVDLAPDQPLTWIEFTRFLLELNRNEEALELLEEASLYSDEKEIFYLKVACLFSLGKRKEAMLVLSNILSDHFRSYEKLFEYAPDLESDTEVIDMIEAYSND